MLLTIDVGNTNLTAGVFSGRKLKYQFDIPTETYSRDQLIKKIRNLPPITNSIICSVVPKLIPLIKKDLRAITGKNPYIIGKDIRVPIKNLYQPGQAGQDRLVNAYGASRLYPAPLIIIDSGTAITFDVISRGRSYLGGLIFPGMRLCLEALNEKTALLPKVKLQPPKELIGRDTQNSILNGVILGIAALTKELSAKIKLKLGKNTQIIGTGGNIRLIQKYAGMEIKVIKDLTLIGLNLIYENGIIKDPHKSRKSS